MQTGLYELRGDRPSHADQDVTSGARSPERSSACALPCAVSAREHGLGVELGRLRVANETLRVANQTFRSPDGASD